MTRTLPQPAAIVARLAAGSLLSLIFAGCMAEGSISSRGNRGYETGELQTTAMIQDDYDYYPGYEVYYSRNRHEYVYRDGNTWVRRPEPRGVPVNVLLAAPSVRLEFHDAPERHHDSVAKTYPKNWKPPTPAQESQKPGGDKKGDDRKD